MEFPDASLITEFRFYEWKVGKFAVSCFKGLVGAYKIILIRLQVRRGFPGGHQKSETPSAEDADPPRRDEPGLVESPETSRPQRKEH